jgi:hypothetical protein
MSNDSLQALPHAVPRVGTVEGAVLPHQSGQLGWTSRECGWQNVEWDCENFAVNGLACKRISGFRPHS